MKIPEDFETNQLKSFFITFYRLVTKIHRNLQKKKKKLYFFETSDKKSARFFGGYRRLAVQTFKAFSFKNAKSFKKGFNRQ